MRCERSVTTILLVAGLVMGLVSCDHNAEKSRTIFAVSGMHCDACSTSIVTALERVEGVDQASADYEMGMAEVTYQPRKVDVQKLKAEIEKLGYTVTGMKTEAVEG